MTSIEKNPVSVSVIGLGAMGTALAEAFLREGYATTVWNRSREKAGRLAEKGAIPAETVAEAVGASPVVIVCVLDYEVVQELLSPLGEALAGKAIVNLTNGTPRQARDMAVWAERHDAGYLDGGIMAVPPMIGRPEALVLYSGSGTAYEKYQWLLGSLGTGKYVGPDPGMASLYDLSLLSAMYGMFAGSLHAIALAGSAGVKARDLTPLVTQWLMAMSGALPHLAHQIDSGNYQEGVVSNLGMQAAAFDNILAASREQGIRTDLLAPLKALMDQRVAQGYPADDLSGVIELIREPVALPGKE